QLIREEIHRALAPPVTQKPQATQAAQIPQAAQANQTPQAAQAALNPPTAQAGPGPRTWAEKAKTAPNTRPQLRAAKSPQNPNPVRELRQITIRGKDIAPEFRDRSAAETVLAVNNEGGKGGCRAANKLPSGDIRLTFDANTKEWHTQNTTWVTKVFGSPQALGVKTFAVLAKGIPKELLGAPLRQTAEEMGEANAVTIYRARAKIFRSGAPTVGLLLEFTAVSQANKLIAEGLFWDSCYYECEAYSGDSRPQQCFQCWGYGHKAQYCTKTPRCPDCNARKHPQGTPCPVETGQRRPFCGACKGEHSAKDTKHCPVARQQWQLAKQLHNDRQIFFPEHAQIPSAVPGPAAMAPPAPGAPASAAPALVAPASVAPALAVASVAPASAAPALAPAPAPEQRP